ncbi:sensory transduction protein LytR [Desulfosporosinus acididurans]|uniref:Sensory transduction protein LytR n=1 Tax=Desulfosporosinus acididurans TaxID=476652 RepID=A0A0J1FVW0_9FIRM|nr:LytTR family DNA-binding domain-containing protein [Desulfosporosinus acididurans]KLU67555.1 sensory transduction protein LytR [Desulfosporosinus acididurans]
MRKLAVQINNNYAFINPQNIILITRKDRKSVIYSVSKTYSVNESLGRLEQLLDNVSFFRCHKGYIVNVEMVAEFTPYGNKTYLVTLMNTNETALITIDKAKEFRQKYCLE